MKLSTALSLQLLAGTELVEPLKLGGLRSAEIPARARGAVLQPLDVVGVRLLHLRGALREGLRGAGGFRGPRGLLRARGGGLAGGRGLRPALGSLGVLLPMLERSSFIASSSESQTSSKD